MKSAADSDPKSFHQRAFAASTAVLSVGRAGNENLHLQKSHRKGGISPTQILIFRNRAPKCRGQMTRIAVTQVTAKRALVQPLAAWIPYKVGERGEHSEIAPVVLQEASVALSA